VPTLLCAGDGEARGWGWNSVFLYGKQFAFTWDRASCGSGLDFSVQRYYVQGYQHTGWNRRFGSGLGVLQACLACLWLCFRLSVQADTEAVPLPSASPIIMRFITLREQCCLERGLQAHPT